MGTRIELQRILDQDGQKTRITEYVAEVGDQSGIYDTDVFGNLTVEFSGKYNGINNRSSRRVILGIEDGSFLQGRKKRLRRSIDLSNKNGKGSQQIGENRTIFIAEKRYVGS